MATVAAGVGGMGLGRAKLHTLNPKPPSLFSGKKSSSSDPLLNQTHMENPNHWLCMAVEGN